MTDDVRFRFSFPIGSDQRAADCSKSSKTARKARSPGCQDFQVWCLGGARPAGGRQKKRVRGAEAGASDRPQLQGEGATVLLMKAARRKTLFFLDCEVVMASNDVRTWRWLDG